MSTEKLNEDFSSEEKKDQEEKVSQIEISNEKENIDKNIINNSEAQTQNKNPSESKKYNEFVLSYARHLKEEHKRVNIRTSIFIVTLIVVNFIPLPLDFLEVIFSISKNNFNVFSLLETILYIIVFVCLIIKIIFHKRGSTKISSNLDILYYLCIFILIIINIVDISKNFNNNDNSSFNKSRIITNIIVASFDILFIIFIIIMIKVSKKKNLSFIKLI